MSVAAGQVSCAATATLVLAAADTASYLTQSEMQKQPYRSVTLLNISTQTVFIGSSGVTTTTGYQLPQNATVTVSLHPLDPLYGITATTTATVHYITSG